MVRSRLSPFRLGFFKALAWVPLLVFCVSCGKADPARAGNPPPRGAGPPADLPAGSPAAPPAGPGGGAGGGLPASLPPEALIALLRPAEIPLWFEVSAADVPDAGAPPAGPRHIRSPAEAGLAPFTPWPLAPHVAATLAAGDALYLAVNRDSLLVVVPAEGGDLGLYRFDVTAYWESYTVGNL
ncbi:MAG: hypothetical protein LBO76_01855, partial [Treponema sp.]|nr:hypothetical protein [Treponema sp.]